jgi:histidinol-phosphate aminotransferase
MSAARPLIRPAVAAIDPYRPGRPIEAVRREFGLSDVIKLASNESPFGPFPAARSAIDECTAELNRYPDGAVHRLTEALAARHGVDVDQICAGSGADGCIDMLSQAVLDPGDEIVCGWPSFPSYAIYAAKQGALVTKVALDGEGRHDLDAMRVALGPHTKLLYVCDPNNPTGTMNSAAELDALLDAVPADVLTVIDQAYFEYVDRADYPDAVERYLKAGRRVLVLRTFSKIYGLAGLRVGYAIGPSEVCASMVKLRRPFDISSPAQQAAVASLDDNGELDRRRELNAAGRAELEAILRSNGLEPVAGAVGNFVMVATQGPAEELCEALLRHGLIVRPLRGFGAPDAVRITVGTPEELAALAGGLTRVLGS